MWEMISKLPWCDQKAKGLSQIKTILKFLTEATDDKVTSEFIHSDGLLTFESSLGISHGLQTTWTQSSLTQMSAMQVRINNLFCRYHFVVQCTPFRHFPSLSPVSVLWAKWQAKWLLKIVSIKPNSCRAVTLLRHHRSEFTPLWGGH